MQFYIFTVILASIVHLNQSEFPSLFRAKSDLQIYKVTLAVPMVIYYLTAPPVVWSVTDDTPVLLWYLLLHRYPLSSHWSMAVSASSLSSSQTANGKKMRVNDWTNRWRRTWSNALVSSYEEKQPDFNDRT